MISIVIPAFNEGASIKEAVSVARSALHSLGAASTEVVVVDDGSSDDTGIQARSAGARVIRHPHNVGYGRSLKDGIAAASNDCILIMDADLTYPMDSLPLLLASYREGYDMVIGARTGSEYSESIWKTPLRWLLKLLVEFTVGRVVPDVNSGFRMFSRAAVMEHFDHLCDTFSFTTSVTLAYMMTGRFVKYIPIGYNKRVGRSKVKLVRDALRTMQYIVQAMVFYNPIKIFTLLALACLVLAGVCLVAAVLTNALPAWILCAGGILVCPVICSFGLIASLMKQTHVSSAQASLPSEVIKPVTAAEDGFYGGVPGSVANTITFSK